MALMFPLSAVARAESVADARFAACVCIVSGNAVAIAGAVCVTAVPLLM